VGVAQAVGSPQEHRLIAGRWDDDGKTSHAALALH